MQANMYGALGQEVVKRTPGQTLASPVSVDNSGKRPYIRVVLARYVIVTMRSMSHRQIGERRLELFNSHPYTLVAIKGGNNSAATCTWMGRGWSATIYQMVRTTTQRYLKK